MVGGGGQFVLCYFHPCFCFFVLKTYRLASIVDMTSFGTYTLFFFLCFVIMRSSSSSVAFALQWCGLGVGLGCRLESSAIIMSILEQRTTPSFFCCCSAHAVAAARMSQEKLEGK